MAELAKNELPGTDRGSVTGQLGKIWCLEGAIRTLPGGVEDLIVRDLAILSVPMIRVVRTMPMVLPFLRLFMEDVTAVRA